jgi:hypothetical protein
MPLSMSVLRRGPMAFTLTPIWFCNISGTLQNAANGEAWQKEILLATGEPIETEADEAEIKLADGANSGNSNIFTGYWYEVGAFHAS